MPFDGTESSLFENHPLSKLGAVERLLATERQWCKGKLRDSSGRHCLVGAMQAVEARQVLEPIVLRAAKEVGGKCYWRIEFFNDDPRTTHADVLRVLRLARENIIAGMVEGDRYHPWHQKVIQAMRALCSGLLAKARDGFRSGASATKLVLTEPVRACGTSPADESVGAKRQAYEMA